MFVFIDNSNFVVQNCKTSYLSNLLQVGCVVSTMVISDFEAPREICTWSEERNGLAGSSQDRTLLLVRRFFVWRTFGLAVFFFYLITFPSDL